MAQHLICTALRVDCNLDGCGEESNAGSLASLNLCETKAAGRRPSLAPQTTTSNTTELIDTYLHCL